MKRNSVTALLASVLLSCAPGELGSDERDVEPNPCVEPVRWRIGQVDERFGISAERLREMVEAAARIWEEPTGRRFFVYDPVAGLPIHLVYDERQAFTITQRAQREELSSLESAVRQQERAYEQRRLEYDNARYADEQAALHLRQRVEAHNRVAQAWNARGGAPEMYRRLQVDAAQIERDRAGLERAARELEDLRRRVEAEAHRLQEAIDRHQDAAREYNRANPARRIHSGVFNRTVETRGGQRVEVRSALTVYQFTDTDHLLLVLAHELGHALGLEHVEEPLAVMRETHATDYLGGPVHLQQADLEALVSRCGVHLWISTEPPRKGP